MDAEPEISQLVAKERAYRGNHQDDALLALFYPDATFTTSWQSGPIATFVGHAPVDYKNNEQTKLPLVGQYGYPIVHRHGQRAYVEVAATTYHWQLVNGVEAIVTSFMRLVYRVEKRTDTWLISDLTSIDESDMLQPAIPGQDLHVKRQY